MRSLLHVAWIATLCAACGGETHIDDDDDDDGGVSGTSTNPSSSGPGAGTGGMGAGGMGSGASGSGGAGDDAPTVTLTASGDCSPDFGGTISVATNSDSLAVYSQNGGGTDSSIQVALQGATGLQTLSTQHRVDTGIVINLIDDGATWTNIASFEPDPVTGTLNILENAQSDGRVDLVFTGVTLVLTGTQPSYCVLNGNVQTYGPYFGQ